MLLTNLSAEQIVGLNGQAFSEGILFVVNIIIMLVSGMIKPKTDIYIPETTDVIDTTPWKYATIIGILITLLVLSTYLIF